MRQIITKAEAEQIAEEQVQLLQNAKFVCAGNHQECFEEGMKTKYYEKNDKVWLWRLDREIWNDNNEGDEWAHDGWKRAEKIYTNEKKEYWYVIAEDISL